MYFNSSKDTIEQDTTRPSESTGLVVTSGTLIREDPSSTPGASYLGKGSVVVLHHQANAGVDAP